MTAYFKSGPVAFALLILLVSGVSFGQAPAWEASKDGEKVYVGGTIHMLSASDYPLPEAFNLAFSEAQHIVFEVDIGAASSPELQAKFLPIMLLQDGTVLQSKLSADTFVSLQNYMTERGMDISRLNGFSPAGISLTLTVLEMQRLGITEEHGVETYFTKLARQSAKDVLALETIDQQIQYLNRLNDLDADMLVNSTLRDAQALGTEWNKMIDAWKEGDVKRIEPLSLNPMIDEAPDLYQYLLVERNRNWASKINDYMSSTEVEFVLVGALHLAGNDSLLKMLESEGYSIRQLK